MPAKVADASILAAMFFQESRAEEAASLLELENVELLEPTLMAYELTSVARKKVRDSPEREREILQGLARVLAMEVQWLPVDHLAVFWLALDTGLTTYDASYLWLARAMSVPLVTFDERLARISDA